MVPLTLVLTISVSKSHWLHFRTPDTIASIASSSSSVGCVISRECPLEQLHFILYFSLSISMLRIESLLEHSVQLSIDRTIEPSETTAAIFSIIQACLAGISLRVLPCAGQETSIRALSPFTEVPNNLHGRPHCSQ